MDRRPRVAVVVSSLVLALVAAGAVTKALALPYGVRVTDAFAWAPEGEPQRPDETIQPSDLLAIEVSDLKLLIGNGHERCRELRLAFDLVVFENTAPFRCLENLVVFNLERIDSARETAWQNLVGKRRDTVAYTNISLMDSGANEILPSDAMDRPVRLDDWRYQQGDVLPSGPVETRVTEAFVYDPEARGELPKAAVKPSETTEQAPDAAKTAAAQAAVNAAAALAAAKVGDEYKTIQLSSLLALKVSGLSQLIGEGNDRCGELRLAFDRVVFEDTVPYRCTADLVVFNLELIDREGETAWQNLVAKRRGIVAHANISLRDSDGEVLPSDAIDRQILLYNRRYGLVALVGFIGVLVGFFLLARKSSMLRDSGSKKSKDLRPYSLARVQTAWWFFLVLSSFLFISLINGTLTEIPGTVLGLMGIAGGTFLGSELVDSSRRNKLKAPPVASPGGTGFFTDIFSDAGGVAFHRFQMFVWTLALGVIFIIRVFRNLEMPVFDTSILGLMGLSSGTYLGMKIPETPKGEGVDDAEPVAGEGFSEPLPPKPGPNDFA